MKKLLIFLMLMFPVQVFAAFGEYTGTHWDTNASGCAFPASNATDGTYVYVLDTSDDEVYKFTTAGSYQSKFSLELNFDERVIYTDGSNIYTTGDYSAAFNYHVVINTYNMSGVYQSSLELTFLEYKAATGLYFDGTYFYVSIGAYDDIEKIDTSGNSIATYDVYNPAGPWHCDNPLELTKVNSYFYIVSGSDYYMYKFDESFNYQSERFYLPNDDDTYDGTAGICSDVNYFYRVEQVDDEVYLYDAYVPSVEKIWNDAILNDVYM